MAEDPVEARMRVIESRVDVHEAVCGERFKRLVFGQWVTHGLLTIIACMVGSALAGENLLLSLFKLAR